jgi:hypothetical protein
MEIGESVGVHIYGSLENLVSESVSVGYIVNDSVNFLAWKTIWNPIKILVNNIVRNSIWT